jgi:hypothetical protein
MRQALHRHSVQLSRLLKHLHNVQNARRRDSECDGCSRQLISAVDFWICRIQPMCRGRDAPSTLHSLSQLTVPEQARSTDDDGMTTAIGPTELAFGEHAKGDASLPSWNEGPTKKSIIDFVHGVTTSGGPQFVRPEERIAVFDNDGTLWSEMPAYFQLSFVFDRLKALAPQHPNGATSHSTLRFCRAT